MSPRAGCGVWLRLVLLMLVLAVVGLIATLLDASNLLGWVRSVHEAGPAGLLIFVLMYAGCTLGPIPRNVLSTVAGTIFGLWWGLPVVYLGSLLGAAVAFWLARRLGREAVRKLGGPRVAAFNDILEQRGVFAVVGARLAPVVPFTAFNYAAGLSDIRRGTYWLGTVIGIVPGTTAYVAVSAFSTAPAARLVELVATAALLLVMVAYVVRRRGAPR